MKNLNKFKHRPKIKNQKNTSILLSEDHLKFIKKHKINLSLFVRAEIDKIIKKHVKSEVKK